MPDRFHAHVPLSLVDDYLAPVRSLGLPLEIAVKAADLDRLATEGSEALVQRIRALGVHISLHAPFLDLSPASVDPQIRQVTEHRFGQTLDLAEQLQAHTIVFHPGYDRWRFSKGPSLWIDQSLDFWPPFIQRAAAIQCRLVLENIFEEAPDNLAQLLGQLDTPWMGHCFDIGHWALFAHCSLEEWFERLGPWMTHLHLHDNHGVNDDHLPIGEGSIDFSRLKALLDALPQTPSFTLEAHSLERLHRSLQAARALLL